MRSAMPLQQRVSRRRFLAGMMGLGMMGDFGAAAKLPQGKGRTMEHHRTDWMAGRYGLMVHWIAPGPAPEKGEWIQDLNRAVDGFNLDRFMEDFHRTGAEWLIFTIGQNSARYASPNSTLDRLAGPGHCSKRDLALEIAERLHRAGKRFIAYLPSEVNAPEALHKPFAWNPADQSEFQVRYTDFIREYAERYGKLCSGWWFDGCYTWPQFNNSLYQWPLWITASRAGNPDAVIAFNDGSFCTGSTKPVTAYQDYLSGEIEALKDGKIRLGRDESRPLYLPTSRFVGGTKCQWHGLVPIDCFWAHEKPGPMEPPRYSDADLISFVRNCTAVGGAVTLNAGIYQEGHLGEQTVAQVARLRGALRE